MIIYKITNKKTGKLYVGQTVQKLSVRLNQHSKCRKTAIYFAIEKYGFDSFIVEEIERCQTRQELNEREVFWIQHFDCIAPKGYNLVSGGGYQTISEETRAKMKLINLGRKRTPEEKEKQRQIHLGKKLTEETKQKQSESHKKRNKLIPHHMIGKTLDEPWKQAISKAHKASGKMIGNTNGKGRKGITTSSEAKEKQSIARKLWWDNKRKEGVPSEQY